MKAPVLFVAAALTSFVCAENTPPPLTFTYQSLTGGSVITTSTTYPAKSSTCQPDSGPSPPRGWGQWQNSHVTPVTSPTSYKVNSSHLAYPTYPPVPSSVANSSPGAGLLNATGFAQQAIKLVMGLQNANSTNCQLCKDTMTAVVNAMKVEQELLSDISVPFCQALPVIPFNICIGLLRVASNDIGGIFPAMDMQGQDGQTLCAYMFGLCPIAPVPQLDLQTLFKNTTKPAPRKLKKCHKKPLKVLHFSDYHLDMRYVVGSEANSTSAQVACRVYPYDNASAPVMEPASLFGNYLCDTPAALGTSVFRNIPAATGHSFDDFAFGIFTGDLVSHDLWELTEPYVLAEELESYQQFFNGLGGLPLYPTLGNHDTFPHAFTSFPYQNNILPANASYPTQELYNYQAVSAAWANYGWLDVETAQSVVASGLGIYRTVTQQGLVIISLNSDVWYYFNLYAYINANKVDPTGAFALLIDYLLDAESKNQPVWIIQHIPTGGSTTFESLPAASDLYYAIVDRFNNTIRATFTGHTHEDEFGVFYGANGTSQTAAAAAAVAYIGQSVTPYTNLNAGFRYYDVDPETFDILDHHNFYANISDTDAFARDGDATWLFEYSAKQTYDYNRTLAPGDPLSPAFWHTVANDIRYNDTTYHTYTDLRTKLKRPYIQENFVLKARTLCGLTSMSIPLFEDCLGSMNSISAFL